MMAPLVACAPLSTGIAIASEKTEISPAQHEFFEKKVRPVLVENCYKCHDASAGKMRGGLAINTPSGLLQGGDSGPALVPGKVEESRLIEAVRYRNRDLQMPPKSPLSDQQVKDLEAWVAMGAPDPRSNEVDSKVPGESIDLERARSFWSFSPLRKPALPEGKHPVDYFIHARLADAKLPASGPASKESWLRRVTFGLTGLPPTPEEIDAYLEDSSPEADEKVVDRLLASPDYGIRWGRHWLDVARYADSNGLDENLAFANAWRYRDWVIESFQDDRPFDEFLIHQIAGDLVEGADKQTITATGFLALGARVLAEPDNEKLQMDVIDEQLDTTGKAFLGMTLGCARCHDHKFDPILQSDYYSLAAIFRNSTNFAESKTGAIHHWFEHDFANEAEKEELKEWDKKISDAKRAASKFKSDTQVKLRGVARSKAVDYLFASLEIEARDSLSKVKTIADKYDLHPRILYHCRTHLDVHRESAVFAPWWKFRESGDKQGLRNFYEDRIGRAVLAFSELQKEDPKAKTLPDEELEPFREALFDKSGFLAVPAKPEHAFEPEDLAEYNRLAEQARLTESHAPDHPSAMGIADAEEINDTLPLHIRGSHRNLGDPVPRAIPAVFAEDDTSFPADSSGRLELAQWMASPDNPLTPRVIVNRAWRWHFGTGLVSTTENFGMLGEAPSHPELLDYLATWFVENGWSIKKLNRLILLSDTYRRSTQPAPELDLNSDPENRLLAYFPVLRLEAEPIRDAILTVSGRLDPATGGKTIPLRNRQMVFNHTSKDHTTYDSLRRTAYLPIVRNHLFDWLHLFDYPDPTMPTGSRASTVIAPQALLLMNSPLAIDSANAFAARVRSEAEGIDARISHAWKLALGRSPSPRELEAARSYLSDQEDTPEAWTLFAQGLFSSNQFLFLQ